MPNVGGVVASIRKRTAKDGTVSYRVDVRLKGFPAQRATFRRLTDAKKWATNTESAIREGRYFRTTEARKHTLGDAIARYRETVLPTKPKDRKKQLALLAWWDARIGGHTLADVGPALIGQCRDELLAGTTKRGTKRSPATVVRYLAALSNVLTAAAKEWGWLEDSPMRKVRKPTEPRGRVRYLSDEEREALLTACKDSDSPYLYPAVVLALSTGMRKGELMNLTWPDVDIPGRRITLHETKNGERRVVPLSGHAVDAVRAIPRRIDTILLFPGKVKRNKPIDLRVPWRAALKSAEITDFRWHDLRHSTASYLAMTGATPVVIAEVLGHKTLQMVKRYAHLSEAHTAGVVESMNKKIFG
jgi:integrase